MTDQVPLIFQYLAVIVLGLLLGSFATAISYRVPLGLPWALGQSGRRSACPSCGFKLGILDLFPVFSWILLRGKCRSCTQAISFVYPLIELVTVLLIVAAFAVLGPVLEFVWVAAAIPFLVSLTVIDLKTYSLPNQLVLILLMMGILRLFVVGLNEIDQSRLFDMAAGGIVYGAGIWGLGWIMNKILGKEALGFGDVKLIAVFGLWLGLSILPYFLMISGLAAVFYGLLWKKITGSQRFPFGPALIAAFYILLLAGGSQMSQIHLH